jgi:uncharacterized protein (DUF2141 family)
MKRKTLSNVLGIAGLAMALTVSFGGAFSKGQTMTITVDGVRSNAGVVHVLVYDEAKAFEASSATDLVTYATVPASADAISVGLHQVEAGTYALAIHHDENANDRFDTRGQTPLEGWGYSNNVGQLDVPSFADASFQFGDVAVGQSITMNYAD